MILKALCKPLPEDTADILRSEYHSHFIAYNDGNSTAIEVELALLDENQSLLEGYRETVLGVGKELEFKPILNRPEGRYYLICQYKQVASDTWYQVLLPLKLKRASRAGEVYVISGELEFKFGIPREDKIEIFLNKPK